MSEPVTMRTIDGDGFTLEPQVAAHAAPMFAVLCDPAIYEHENAPPESVEWLRHRFHRLETRRSADGCELWLNWVARLPDGRLAGYVQATVHADGSAGIAYEFASAHWGRGLGTRCVQAMIAELHAHYGVRTLTAVLKGSNARSLRLLVRLGFAPAPDAWRADHGVLPDELILTRAAAPP